MWAKGMKPQSQHPETDLTMPVELRRFDITIMLLLLFFFFNVFGPIYGPCNVIHDTYMTLPLPPFLLCPLPSYCDSSPSDDSPGLRANLSPEPSHTKPLSTRATEFISDGEVSGSSAWPGQPAQDHRSQRSSWLLCPFHRSRPRFGTPGPSYPDSGAFESRTVALRPLPIEAAKRLSYSRFTTALN